MKTSHLNPQIPSARPHFVVLDGLRGVAALAIVVFHFMEWVITDFSKNFIGHGFLAVDFFFCLSGFVIAYAYDHRIGSMGLAKFFKARLVRLHPLVILGSVLGLIAFLLDPFEAPPAVYDAGKILLIFVCSILLIPYPVMEDRAFNLFGLNAPSWSLFWEYVANIFYALILNRLPRALLVVLTMVAAGGIIWVSNSAGNLLGGWSKDNFWHGGARIAYSFLAGMLIYRYNLIIQNKLGFALLTLILSLAFLMPYASWNWLAEALIVLIYFPLIVSLGAGTSLSNNMSRVCVFSGEISYPLYMTHYAGIWIFGHYFTNKNPPTSELALVIVLGVIVLVAFAYVVMKWFDLPVRRWLMKKLMR